MARIRVRSKVSGRLGTISEEQFDPARYQRIEDSQGDLLGGVLPPVAGFVGGIGGGFLGGPPGAIAGAGITAGSAKIIQENLESLLGRQQETPVQQVQSVFKEGGKSASAEALGLGVARLLGPLARPVTRTLLKTIPGLFAKLGIRESGKAGQQAFSRAASGRGLELGEEAVQRGVFGRAKTLSKLSQEQISGKTGTGKTIKTAVETKIKEEVAKIKGKPNIKAIINKARARAAKTVTGSKALKTLKGEAADIARLQIRRTRNFSDLLSLRRSADQITKGKSGQEITSTARKLNAELANVIREELSKKNKTLRELIPEEQFFIRLNEAVSREGIKKPLSIFELLPILGGFLGGTALGGPTAGLVGAGIAGTARSAFTPGGASALARGSQLLGQGLVRTGPTANRIGTRLLLELLTAQDR